ncbi:hybrid sensor histidine kinase/response regulator [Variovorax sp. KBW07]|uniref:ATP-binding response regulator n=1 Tax=Variovorax sp. KBW07 TaxID=2153358 RepID=UPI001625D79F|nr:hybrid sensor histidine kinase/response regulator [Variovorax sp. KBW07]
MSASFTPTPTDPVFAARMAALHRNFPFSLLGVLFTVGLVIAALFGAVSHAQLAAWAVANTVLTAARAWNVWRFRHAMRSDAALRRWRLGAIAGAVAGGLLWGLPLAYWMLQVPLAQQMFIVVAMLTMGTGAIYAYCIDLGLLYGFQVPYFLPAMLALGTLDDVMLRVMSVAGVLYLFVTLAFAHRMYRTQVDSLQLRFENLHLLDRLRHEKEAAERSDLAKSRFLAAASHDLRQPVHALSLFVGVLRGQALPATSRHLVDSIGRAAAAMGMLFEGLLNISRLDAGVVRVSPKPFALASLLDQIQLEFAPQAAAKSLVLRLRTPDATVRSDPALLDRVLRNLVENAIRYTARGSVLIGCRRAGPNLRIEVWDTGPGIPEAEHERVFWEFHQLANPERDRTKGMGLGLAIVRRTAGLLGHALTLRSRVGHGTVFAITVPLAHEAPTAAPQTRPAALLPEPGGQLILMVEDDAESRHGLQLLLESWGHRVVAAESGAQLLKEVTHRPGKPALVISDYRLREGETGVDVIDRVHEEYNDDGIPALLVSGDTDPQRLSEVAARGWQMLHKPVAPAQLRAAINRLLLASER